jgi:NAD-dependent dihydropyrimidine dehydrogenase PreA subunit
MSPNISGGRCTGQIDDMSLWYASCLPPSIQIPASLQFAFSFGQKAVHHVQLPWCPRSNCGICYRVTNQGGYAGGHIGGVGNSVVVQIVDSCPASHPANFCKTNVPADQRCAPGVNTLDIDESAYLALTGQPFGSVS